MKGDLFELMPLVYEKMVDWPRRLGHEGPFYRHLFEQVQAQRVVDVACGTGHHAQLFNSWNLTVEGADASSEMIATARERHGESPTLRWVVRSFDKEIARPGSFDAAVCIGNSLALANDPVAARHAIEQMLSAVRPGGAIVIHLLNLWRLPDGPCQWQKCLRMPIGEQDLLVHKGVHRAGERGFVNVILTDIGSASSQMHSESVPLIGLDAPTLQSFAREGGSTTVTLYGGYKGEPYRPDSSQDLIMVASK
jgi:SAM-dependent methyltransferase